MASIFSANMLFPKMLNSCFKFGKIISFHSPPVSHIICLSLFQLHLSYLMHTSEWNIQPKTLLWHVLYVYTTPSNWIILDACYHVMHFPKFQLEEDYIAQHDCLTSRSVNFKRLIWLIWHTALNPTSGNVKQPIFATASRIRFGAELCVYLCLCVCLGHSSCCLPEVWQISPTLFLIFQHCKPFFFFFMLSTQLPAERSSFPL